MTKTIVTQETKEIKRESFVKSLKDTDSIRNLVTAEILKGNFDDVIAILRSCGWHEHEKVVSLARIAEFYDVELDYLRGVMTRANFSKNTIPTDVVDNPFVPKERLYSVRIVLALAHRMCCGRTVPKDSKASQVWGALMKSAYYQRAKDQILEKSNKSMGIETNTATVTSNGEIVMTTDFFTNVFKQFGTELVSAITKASNMAYQNKGNYPDSVGTIVQKYQAGEISKGEACKLIGCPIGSFYYRIGKEICEAKSIATS